MVIKEEYLGYTIQMIFVLIIDIQAPMFKTKSFLFVICKTILFCLSSNQFV